MESLFVPLINKVLEYGLLGAITLGAVIGYVYERRRNSEIQEKRITESHETIKALEKVTYSLDKLTEAIRIGLSRNNRYD